MSGQWYYMGPDGEAKGPRSTDGIVDLLRHGDMRVDTLVCPIGGQDWRPLGDHAEFIDVVRAVAPPPPGAGWAQPPAPHPAPPYQPTPHYQVPAQGWAPPSAHHAAPPVRAGAVRTQELPPPGPGQDDGAPAPLHPVPNQLVWLKRDDGPAIRATLRQVAKDHRARRLPDGALVQLAAGSQWIAVDDALARCSRLQPIRIWPLAILLVFGPFPWTVLHLVIFGWNGMLFLWMACTISFVLGIVLLILPPVRKHGPIEVALWLKGKPAAAAPALVVLLSLLACPTGFGLTESRRQERIDGALAAAKIDPCAIETLSEADRDSAGFFASTDVEAAVKACQSKKEEAARDAAAHKREEQRVADCRKLGKALGGPGALQFSQYPGLDLDAERREFFGRVHGRSLLPVDLEKGFSDILCGDQQAIHDAYLRAVGGSRSAWTDVSKVSPELMAALKTKGLDPEVGAAFRQATERRALTALAPAPGTDADDGDNNRVAAKTQCDVAQALGSSPS